MNIRDAIRYLQESGELQVIDKEVHWKYDIGSICRNNSNTPYLFKNISEYDGFKLFTGGFASGRSISVILNTGGETSFKKITNVIRNRLEKSYSPQILNKNYQQNGFSRIDPVNLYKLPVPWWDRRDCGRYIGTWHANISKDVIDLSRNVGIYRMLIIDEKHTTVNVSAMSHLYQQFVTAEKKGVDLEMVTVIGTEEEVVMAASAAVPKGVDELEIAGAFACNPIIISHCESIALEYPIHSEIVIEGKLKAGVRVNDGPFADYTGEASSNANALLYEITALYCQNNCIFRGMAVGNPGAEDHNMLSILASAGMMHFHGSNYRNYVQAFFLRHRLFSLFQLSGKKICVFR
jgi:4-hydroxy-3-polyprenylbenzoate decarboxylase